MDLLSVSKEYTKIDGKCKRSSHLVVREGSEIVYIDKVEANNTIMMASTIGKRSPMYCTSVGKAILAHLPEKKVKEIWDNSKIVKYTDYTITDFEELKTELEDIRQKGYAVDNEENEIGVRCIGVPIFNRHGKVEAAISISGPAIRVTESKISNFSIKVMNTASLISRELGFIR